ncbi:molybdate ABC transporter substrate-binding protein [Demequina sp. SYSU T00039]|uniref:Molybdate ABC transporter substrate-binding protein n=1 Tax=Demequina lignilytica TaxID=3051663 RepID=A0AAW7M6Y1_9MICO|nr:MULTISPECIES: molybdate ABC transporter substrate-binding protein [unclassified Demequina]MDN4478440.1 molybdate ABC transporter substrate-binding protein [Demequina sp. SYSU T00039-1]MDN4487053.1 molybdate ABC transporter substrate-binding protein [Demequina sp. SYSU T00039]
MRRVAGIVVLVLLVATIGAVLAGSFIDRGEVGPAHDGITVFAAASLTDVVEQVVDEIHADLPWADITVAYGGSSDLAAQILEGAPATIFLSADEAQGDAVADGLGLDEPAAFATNTLTIVVPEGNPAAVDGLADLERGDVTSVICAPQVPCGAATAELASLEGLTLSPASDEQSVTDVLSKVAAGQADAGVVYVTDVARASGVEEVPIAGAERVVNTYVAVAIPGDHDPSLAARFWDDLVGAPGRAILADAGFGLP